MCGVRYASVQVTRYACNCLSSVQSESAGWVGNRAHERAAHTDPPFARRSRTSVKDLHPACALSISGQPQPTYYASRSVARSHELHLDVELRDMKGRTGRGRYAANNPAKCQRIFRHRSSGHAIAVQCDRTQRP